MTKIWMISKKEIPYEESMVEWENLAFYTENPRIYSQFAAANERTQDAIQAKLETMDHVKELRARIDSDGQVNEAVFCMAVPSYSDLHGHYKFLVLEGNSRLAALRMEKKGSLPPTHMPCNILDFSAYEEEEIEGLIFSLLGNFHITGRTEWKTYENSAYLYRRYKIQGNIYNIGHNYIASTV